MLDEELKSTKFTSSKRSSTIDDVPLNEVSDESEEEEEMEAGPSTSAAPPADRKPSGDEEEDGEEDDDEEDSSKLRELFAQMHTMLDHDAIFNRIRSQLLDDFDVQIRHFKLMSATRKLTNRERFEFYERVDDFITTFADLDCSHLALLRHSALQLAEHTPLEVVPPEKDLEFEINPAVPQEDTFVEERSSTSPRKARKSKVVDEWNHAAAAKVEANGDAENGVDGSFRTADGYPTDTELDQTFGDVEGGRLNGVHEKNGRPDGDEEDDELDANGRLFSNSDEPLEDAQMDDEKLLSPVEDAEGEESSDSDATERASPAKTRRETKKAARRSVPYSKQNGHSKKETLAHRKSSGRIAKSSRNSDTDVKKKRRAAAVVASASVSESVGRAASQRRNARGKQTNHDSDTPAEPTYCLCEQISYGNMVCCDFDGCDIGWFHYQCVKLTKTPKGKWFCPNCRSDDAGKKCAR